MRREVFLSEEAAVLATPGVDFGGDLALVERVAAARGDSATSPDDTGMPKRANSCLA
jgi:hypothetical protein